MLLPTRLLRLATPISVACLVAALCLASPALAQQSGQSAPSSSPSNIQPVHPAPAPLPTVSLPPEIDRILRDYEKAFAAGNAKGIAALFADDGIALPNNRPPRRGRGAIADGYGPIGGPLSLRATSYAVADSVGYIVGAYGFRAGDADVGKFVIALRRSRGGRWLIAADIDNGNTPPKPRSSGT